MKDRKGQSVPTATFVGLLLLFIIGYILLLPPAEREALLLDLQKEPVAKEGILVEEHPGYIGGVIEYKLSNANLFTDVETEVGDVSKAVYVRRNMFMDRPQNVSFVLKNLENLDKSSLYFVVEEGKGNLNILLNGRSVYSGTAEGVMLFELPLGYLKEENELMIQSFSDIFFMGSSYVLKDFKVIKKYRVENKEARRVFSVPSGVSFVNLKYYLFCGGTVKGKLKISVNGNEVYYGIPSCGVYTESDIPLNYLKKGDNVMEFGIDKGDYVIENIIVLVEVMEEKAEYSFSLSDSEFDDVNSGNLDVLLEASFDNYAEGDEARVYVNDNSFVIEVDDFTDEVISEYVEVGKNLIRIRPLDGFEVTDLRVRFV